MEEIKFPLDVNGYHFESWLDASKQLGYKEERNLIRKYEALKLHKTLEEIFVPSIRKTPCAYIKFPLDVNGYHFINWKDAGIQLGYSSGTPIYTKYKRDKARYSLEEIFVPCNKKESLFPLDVNGYHFEKWVDVAKCLGYNKTAIKHRYYYMKDKHPLEEIFIPKGSDSLFPLDVHGYHFINWEDAGKQLGYSNGQPIKQKYEQMIGKHPLEEIFIPKGSDSLFPLDVNGYHFVSWDNTGKQLGYASGKPIIKRYNDMKDTHTLEEIFVPRKNVSLFPLDINGYHFTSWKDAGEQLGYTSGNVIKYNYDQMKDTHTLEEIFVPKKIGIIFPLDIEGYHFESWVDASKQLKISTGVLRQRYTKNYSLAEVFGFSVHIAEKMSTEINAYLLCQSRFSDNLYKCINTRTCLYELHTYEELNEMWRKFKGIKIVKE